MGKKIKFILAVTFILSLAGCGNQGNTEKATEANPVVQENDNRIEKPENGDVQAAEEENIEQENTKAENTLDGQGDGTVTIVCEDDFTEPAPYFGTLISITGAEEGETVSSLTADQIEDAKQAALAYYEGTVFT